MMKNTKGWLDVPETLHFQPISSLVKLWRDGWLTHSLVTGPSFKGVLSWLFIGYTPEADLKAERFCRKCPDSFFLFCFFKLLKEVSEFLNIFFFIMWTGLGTARLLRKWGVSWRAPKIIRFIHRVDELSSVLTWLNVIWIQCRDISSLEHLQWRWLIVCSGQGEYKVHVVFLYDDSLHYLVFGL